MNDIEAKISEALSDYDFDITDLTAKELQMLREEIIAKENGYFVLDGVLFNASHRIHTKRWKAELKKEINSEKRGILK